jgi:hypothetical protein
MLSTGVLAVGLLMLLFGGGLLLRGGAGGPGADQVRSSARWMMRAAVGVVILAIVMSFLGN